MSEIEEIKKEIEILKKRNAMVETDKAWETSVLRKFLIAIFTYLAITIYMWAIGIDLPMLNAIIPTIGFLLSTLTLPLFKKWWVKKYR